MHLLSVQRCSCRSRPYLRHRDAIKARCSEARVFAWEPARFDATARSLAAGSRRENPDGQKSICDALLSKSPGEG